MALLQTTFTNQTGVAYPIICGPMFPCSNPELVAAVSEAGGMGVVQPLSLVYVHGYDFREGLQRIKSLTAKPFGLNIIVERSSQRYEERMRGYVAIALEEGCRFFITSLGNPRWIVEQTKPYGSIVYHDVTARKWAEKALEAKVDGLICVNNRAGGHAGLLSAEKLFEELYSYDVPLICAGGIGDENDFVKVLKIGYAGVQMGTRFIATKECAENMSYKAALVNANENDIVLTERITGIPLSVLRTPYVEKVGTKIGPISRFFFRYAFTKRLMRIWYAMSAMRQFKKFSRSPSTSDYWQAGKSVAHIHAIESAAEIINRFAKAATLQ